MRTARFSGRLSCTHVSPPVMHTPAMHAHCHTISPVMHTPPTHTHAPMLSPPPIPEDRQTPVKLLLGGGKNSAWMIIAGETWSHWFRSSGVHTRRTFRRTDCCVQIKGSSTARETCTRLPSNSKVCSLWCIHTERNSQQNKGDNRCQAVSWLRCNVKALTQFYATHLFPVPVSVPSSVNTPSELLSPRI